VLCEERNTTACYKGKAKDATRGARAADRQADLAAYLRRFMVEVVEHFDVIAEEPDRTDQPVTNTRMTSFFLPRRAAETVPTDPITVTCFIDTLYTRSRYHVYVMSWTKY